ncbi:MAG TPA: nitroreductase family protein [Thermodesulfobacteriota bacterium]|nr:nitroreductase family protein [Thermodesulfobacteriota bacterium]
MSELISDVMPNAQEVKPLDTLEAIGLRRSIRWYEPNKPVEKWKVQAMLEAARLAPTAGNYNGQRAIVCYRDEDPDIWEFISDWSQITTQMAPILMFWCYDLAAYDIQGQQLHDLMRTGALDKAHGWEYDRVSKLFPLPALLPDFILHRLAAIDLGNALQNAIITATALGLGTCLNGASGGARRNVKKYFNLPDSYVFCWLLTVGYPAERIDGGGARGRPPFETMFFERKVGNPFKRDEKVVDLLKELKLIQPPGPLPGRLEEINKLTKRFGLGDEWLTDWKLEPSQLDNDKLAVDKRPKELSKDEFDKTVPSDVKVEFQVHPTVKREILDQYRKEKGISADD